MIDDNEIKETIDFAGNREIYESLKKGQQKPVSLFVNDGPDFEKRMPHESAGPDHTPTNDQYEKAARQRTPVPRLDLTKVYEVQHLQMLAVEEQELMMKIANLKEQNAQVSAALQQSDVVQSQIFME